MEQGIAAAPVTGRQRIIDAAFRKFADLGYSGVSMQQIADAAGVTKATLYHHFQDKEDLFLEMMREQFGRSQQRLEHAVDAGETFREKLVAYGNVMFSAERADLSRLFGDFHRYVADDRQAAFWERYERPWSYLEGAIGEAIEVETVVSGARWMCSRFKWVKSSPGFLNTRVHLTVGSGAEISAWPATASRSTIRRTSRHWRSRRCLPRRAPRWWRRWPTWAPRAGLISERRRQSRFRPTPRGHHGGGTG